MPPTVKVTVAIVGASGETGRSIVNGLLADPDTEFERGVRVVAADLNGPQEALVELLSGADVVISAIFFGSLVDEKPLAEAAKKAGVKRFLQSALMIVVPPRGVVDFREQKEENLNFIQKLRLPYTYVDAGWCGRFDHVLASSQPDNPIGLDGNVPSALADLRDVGRYVAKIITDPRTLNKRVHVYNELLTRNEVYDKVEALAGEQLPRSYVSEEQVLARIDNARKELDENPSDLTAIGALTTTQLFCSWGIRGDNTPEYAQYLGYLDGKELYPEFEFKKFDDYVKEVLDGTAVGVYRYH
ncbi:NAD(P)-binding protein [Aspergillus keveii]|uniref:NAD(P)-binding protein n=1 Tax=Aspergillus keveii TaxID=714993 RepID=A0ABR4G205_9EURO